MRIGIDGRYIQDHFPGIGRYTYNLVKGLASATPGTDFTVIYNPALSNTRYDMVALSRLENVELVRADISTFSPAEQWLLPRLLRRLRLDVFHSPYYLRPYLLPCPAVVSIYDVIPLLYGQYMPSLWAVAVWLTVRTAAKVITLSESARGDLMRHFHIPPQRIAAIPAAADERFKPLGKEEVASFCRKYGLAPGYVLYLGINKPHKNLARLVEAFARLGGDRRLVLAGREDRRYKEARQAVEKYGLGGRVIFFGDVPDEDLPALYNGAVCFVLPSLYEGFGLPVLEAMACGLPVICAHTSSLPEVAGEAALLVDPLDVEALAEALSRVLSDQDLRAEMRAKSLARAAEFSWPETARRTLAVYREAVG